jgi:hypothetical protein
MSQLDPGRGVRPTRRCLRDLAIEPPQLDVPLDGVEHAVLSKAQRLPELVVAGGEERILALDDRMWFKVKVDTWRAAGCEVDLVDERILSALGRWWVAAAGSRRGDSAQEDFYEQLTAECRARRKAENVGRIVATTQTSTAHLLPDEWDRDRLYAELAVHVRLGVQRLVRRMAAESLRTGATIGFDFQGWQARVLIRAEDGHEAYIAISALGLPDDTTFVLLLTSIPGIASTDWAPEPGGVAGIEPESGEILWSAPMPTEAARRLLAEFDRADVRRPT